MDWHTHFQTIFFGTWQKAGLPHHEDFLKDYYTILELRDKKNDWIKKSSIISPGLDQGQLYAVYGFGVMVGKVFARMLGLDASQAEHTSDWCGRFNLGISLFDHIADEMEGIKSVSSLKVFQPFIKTTETNARTLTGTETLLSQLAGSVLDDLKINAEKKVGLHKTDPLFKLMKQLFDAQYFISKQKLTSNADLHKIKKALYIKSAEPFRVMAEYTARMADANNPELIKKARSIGKAVGYCYWIIDDAKDVWMDLEAGQWNLFLQMAAAEDPSLFAKIPNEMMKDSLVNIWLKNHHAQKISSQIIKRLLHATRRLDLTKEEEHQTLGLVAASLWQWHHS